MRSAGSLFVEQKTAYEMRMSDWSSDVCSSDLDVLRNILRSAVGLASDDADRLNLKITASALKEMRAAFSMFAPFEGIPKATIFGSADRKSTRLNSSH